MKKTLTRFINMADGVINKNPISKFIYKIKKTLKVNEVIKTLVNEDLSTKNIISFIHFLCEYSVNGNTAKMPHNIRLSYKVYNIDNMQYSLSIHNKTNNSTVTFDTSSTITEVTYETKEFRYVSSIGQLNMNVKDAIRDMFMDTMIKSIQHLTSNHTIDFTFGNKNLY